MAVAIERFTPALPRYPWAQWMNGTAYRAEVNVDFTCTIKGFLSSLYTRAERKKRTVETKTIDDRYVEFRFSTPKPARKRRTKPRKTRS